MDHRRLRRSAACRVGRCPGYVWNSGGGRPPLFPRAGPAAQSIRVTRPDLLPAGATTVGRAEADRTIGPLATTRGCGAPSDAPLRRDWSVSSISVVLRGRALRIYAPPGV